MSRSVRIIIALTEAERTALDISAKQAGLSRAAYVRMRALELRYLVPGGLQSRPAMLEGAGTVLRHEWEQCTIAGQRVWRCGRCYTAISNLDLRGDDVCQRSGT